ncbi:hypothetical protein [Streptomyces hirsutus]|uniref:hypothetical protein n=1 Tax=Streptomyces hirsutus TaxID=35620 RepID=UPI0034019B86
MVLERELSPGAGVAAGSGSLFAAVLALAALGLFSAGTGLDRLVQRAVLETRGVTDEYSFLGGYQQLPT